jgi:triosephosphate isomerase (TIM)
MCPEKDPIVWIRSVIQKVCELRIIERGELRLVFLLPEALIPTAIEMAERDSQKSILLAFGCQGVHWENITKGGNFGAFTSLRPASAMVSVGCSWAILGHSEERKAKHQLLAAYDPLISSESDRSRRALSSVSQIIREAVRCAIDVGINVLVCIGETQEEHGEGTPNLVLKNVENVLRQQIIDSLTGIRLPAGRELVIGYEPIWAIGPGKTPPHKHYIESVARIIKRICQRELNLDVPVVYGGGLKIENANEIGSVNLIDGGLVALTRFSGEIGFFPEDLGIIIRNYLSGKEKGSHIEITI